MRLEIDEFSVEAEAETVDLHPKVFRKIFVTYRIKGRDLTEEKVEKAVRLSMDEYCGVSAMLVKATRIETRVIIE
jgi:putative redox protein